MVACRLIISISVMLVEQANGNTKANSTYASLAPQVATFLTENNLAGKIIVPFCTNGGGGLGRIVSDIRKLSDGAEVLDALNLYEDGGTEAEGKISDWLKKYSMKK